MGKTLLMKKVAERLVAEGFPTAIANPMAPMRMLRSICHQFGISDQNIEGKNMNMDELKEAIELWLSNNVGFLLFDDGQWLESRLRSTWIKRLVTDSEQPIAVFVTECPKTDLFSAMPPPLILEPLRDKDIRELAEHTATTLGLKMDGSALRNLSQHTGGTPAGAIALAKGQLSGLDMKRETYTEVRDFTPFILLAAVAAIIYQAIGQGTADPAKIFVGMAAFSVLSALWRMTRTIKPEDKKLRG